MKIPCTEGMPASGRRTLLRWAAAGLLGLSALVPASAAGFDLQALTALLAQRTSAEARFTEERFVSGFDNPLQASGVLSFSAPDRFVRQTLEPQAESMAVEGNTVTLKRGTRSRQMAMDAVPEWAPCWKPCAALSPATPSRWTSTSKPRWKAVPPAGC